MEPWVFLHPAGELEDAAGPLVVVGRREGGAAAEEIAASAAVHCRRINK